MKFTSLGRASAAGISLLLLSTGIALGDGLQVDGDTVVAHPNNVSYAISPNTNERACADRGESVPGEAVLHFNGASHFYANEDLTLSATTPTGVSVSFTGGTTYHLGAWDSSSADLSIALSTVVSTASAGGVVSISISGAGYDNKGDLGVGGYSVDDPFTVTVDCGSTPTNNAPFITSAAFTADSVSCQMQAQLDVTFTDADSSSWTAAVDWDYTSPTFNGTSVGAVTSPFSLYHTYAAPGTHTAGVQVTDDQSAGSNIATDSIDVLQTYSAAFLQPIDGLQATGHKNTFKNGRVLPVKVTITDDCTGDAVTGSTGQIVEANVVKSAPVGGTTPDPVEAFADAGASSGNTDLFRWSTDGFWIYNLDSKALGLVSGTLYELQVVVDRTVSSQTALLQPTK